MTYGKNEEICCYKFYMRATKCRGLHCAGQEIVSRALHDDTRALDHAHQSWLWGLILRLTEEKTITTM